MAKLIGPGKPKLSLILWVVIEADDLLIIPYLAVEVDTKPYDAGQGWSVPVTENKVSCQPSFCASRRRRSFLLDWLCGMKQTKIRKRGLH
jgi:hypothetical protein